MPNYYEILKIAPTATHAEISDAIDAQYNQWRRLVTHYEPKVQNQANESLRLLEQIRGTLTNKVSRAAYDAGIGLGEAVGGLADPAAILQGLTPPVTAMPPVRVAGGVLPQPVAPGALERVDAWVCPRCHTVNPIGTRYCKKCGGELGTLCPKCQHLNEKAAVHCQNCGVNLSAAVEELAVAERERQRVLAEQAAIEQQLVPLRKQVNAAATLSSLWWLLVSGIYGLVWVVALILAQSALGNPAIHHEPALLAKAQGARNKSAVMVALGLVILCFVVLASSNR